VDGLDECEDTRAQEDIIKLIGASVRTNSTPFRWAIFSRAEPHIRSTFEDELIFPTIRILELPIQSPDDDHEVEIYIRHELRNILRRRNRPLAASWPADNDIKALVKAAGGLFAYAAAVLRHIDLSESLRFEAALHDVLSSVSHGGSDPFSGLDAFYMLIMQRIPKKILPSTQLLLHFISQSSRGDVREDTPLVHVSNQLGLSQSDFLSIYQFLHAVVWVGKYPKHLVLPNNVDSSRSYLDQRHLFETTPPFHHQAYGVHGLINFYHKSFYDFLIDPARSFSFCVTTPDICTKFLDSLIECHHHFAQRYALCGNSMLLFTPFSSY
jgi:hypothetical protein